MVSPGTWVVTAFPTATAVASSNTKRRLGTSAKAGVPPNMVYVVGARLLSQLTTHASVSIAPNAYGIRPGVLGTKPSEKS